MASDLKFHEAKHGMTGLILPMRDMSFAGLPVTTVVVWQRARVPRWMVQTHAISMPRGSTGVSVPFTWAQSGASGRQRRRKTFWEGADLCHGLTPTPRPLLWVVWGKWTSTLRWWSHSYVCCWSSYAALSLPVSFGPMRLCWAPDMVHESNSFTQRRGEGRVCSNWPQLM